MTDQTPEKNTTPNARDAFQIPAHPLAQKAATEECRHPQAPRPNDEDWVKGIGLN